ncbi:MULTISPECIES: hypothetical protein [Pseudanabaena]|uniref:hypothetical protein n=1 Tax=Pseudanabaena TaxID=1152 RepID=UPI002478E4DE|nr:MULTISPECIES: hypothetical protein [Pseudanabaena]MEA5489278.1 hypothetical protein [Pseudanabaena sp. CCNP1317]WGS74076.1 hypothetical protein OA858_08625 [Pseudanabaena galeata CCNP1313]
MIAIQHLAAAVNAATKQTIREIALSFCNFPLERESTNFQLTDTVRSSILGAAGRSANSTVSLRAFVMAKFSKFLLSPSRILKIS